MYALVDCNNFYASCERVFRPDLNGKPVVVLSNNDGCVIARSNEAKSLIPMGAPAFKFAETFEQNHIHVFSSNYALYGDMSNRVMNILRTFCPDIEVYSIDEAFLQFNGFGNFDLKEYGEQIRKTVTKWTGIPISIGVAPTKALAKVANKIAKKFPENSNGVHVISSEKSREKSLKWLKIEDVWGVGRRHAKRLNKVNVRNAFQFTQLPDAWVNKNMTVVGLRLKRELEGKPTLSLDHSSPKKAIATTRSFDQMYTKLEQVDERVATFTVSCAEKLRRQNSVCNLVMVFVHTNPFRKDLPGYARNIVMKLPFPTNSSMELLKYTRAGLKKIFKDGYHYKKAGVMVMGIAPYSERQLSVFEGENTKDAKLLDIVDSLNRSIGNDKIKFGCQALDRTWKMKQEKLSPRYTTKLDEILTVKI